MSEKQLRDFAKTKHKGLPEKKTRSEAVKEELIARMQAKIAEQTLEIQPKEPKKPEQPQKPMVDQAAINAAKKAKTAAVALKTRELQTLRQTPPGTNVPSFGG